MSSTSLKHIAEKTGLSVSGVSLALRGSPKISKLTQQRVRKLADELGYIPRPALAAAAAGRFRSQSNEKREQLVYLWAKTSDEKIKDYASDATRYLMSTGKKQGYEVRGISCHPKKVPALLRQFYKQGVVGIILGTWLGELPPLCSEWDKFSILRVGGISGVLPFHVVEEDLFGSAYLTVQQVLSHGYQRIGFAPMSHAPRIHDDDRRLGGLLSAYTGITGRLPDIPPLLCAMDNQAAFCNWITTYQPDCIISFHEGARYWLQDMGKTVPTDVGFATLHINQNSKNTNFSGIKIIDEIIFEATIELMNTAYRFGERGPTRSPRNTFISSTWVEGTTLGKR